MGCNCTKSIQTKIKPIDAIWDNVNVTGRLDESRFSQNQQSPAAKRSENRYILGNEYSGSHMIQIEENIISKDLLLLFYKFSLIPKNKVT